MGGYKKTIEPVLKYIKFGVVQSFRAIPAKAQDPRETPLRWIHAGACPRT